MSWRLRVLVAIERLKLAVSEWAYAWRDWAGANWYLTDDDHPADAEVRDVADSPPPGALAPTSSYGCGDTACAACYGNREWQAWNAHRQGVCYLCGEEYGVGPGEHEADEECPYDEERSEPTRSELDAWCARNLY